MDTENQAGTRGLKLAADKGLAVVIMEPLMGGRLADPPPAIAETIAGDPAHRSPAQLAFEWVWDQPEVSVVLSGMSAMSQVVENLRFADSARVGKLGPADQALIARVREQYQARIAIPCTKCGYCMPCPNDVNIPAQLRTLQLCPRLRRRGSAQFRYNVCAQGRASAQAPASLAAPVKNYARNTSRSPTGCRRCRSCWEVRTFCATGLVKGRGAIAPRGESRALKGHGFSRAVTPVKSTGL